MPTGEVHKSGNVETDPAVSRILRSRIVAILRAEPADALPDVAAALVEAGIDTIEIPVTVSGAVTALAETKSRLGKRVCLGAGSVLDCTTVAAVRDAGCEFVVAPCVDPSVINVCNSFGLPMLAGALSPSEILLAWNCGCPLVKVFPGDIGGSRWLKDLRGPLPQIALMPTGGVDIHNARSYIDAGAKALGVGSSLVPKKAVENRDLDAIVKTAREFLAALESPANPF